MKIDSTEIQDTFAEGFSMRYARLVVTAIDDYWLAAAINEFCGYGTSVIGCDAEVGVERMLGKSETLDGRVGAAILAFGFSTDALAAALVKRTGQCLMTCPTTAVFDGCADHDTPLLGQAQSDSVATDNKVPLGSHLRFFGDGFQKSKVIGDRRFWRIPVMDGEFVIEEHIGIGKGVAGGNLLIQSETQPQGLQAARQAVQAISNLTGVITPFPAGVVRSGSKVGSRYKALVASTSDPYCPSLKGRVETNVHPQANCVYEIVIDGINFEHVAQATKTGIQTASIPGIVLIGAGNYGGKLGKHHFHLHEILKGS